MSVINRVLKDLDRKGGIPSTLNGVQAVQLGLDKPRPRWPWLLLPAVAAAAWWFWPAANPTATPAAPERREDVPRLRMSESLSSPVPASPATAEEEIKAAPATAATPPAESTRPGQKSGAPAALPAPDGEAGKSDAPPVRLDTRLPEPRQPGVVKEIRPPTPREQADLAWRQAARLIEQGRGRDALESLESSLKLEPGHGPARQTLIALHLEAGDLARGETLLREGLELHANDPWYNRSLGQLTLQRGDLKQSAAMLKAGLGKGVDAAYWGLYAGVLNKAGRAEEATQAWREATRLNPAHGPWWVGLAVALEQGGQRPEAAAAYQRALQTRLNTDLREFAARKAAELSP